MHNPPVMRVHLTDGHGFPRTNRFFGQASGKPLKIVSAGFQIPFHIDLYTDAMIIALVGDLLDEVLNRFERLSSFADQYGRILAFHIKENMIGFFFHRYGSVFGYGIYNFLKYPLARFDGFIYVLRGFRILFLFFSLFSCSS